jgi:hypothetical protein
MKVKCPNCTRISFETTDQFNPDLPPHGGMVRCLLQYHIDWLCAPTTKASEMCCPECLAPLVVGGVLNVAMPAREAGEFLGMKIIESNQIPDNVIAMVSGDKVILGDGREANLIDNGRTMHIVHTSEDVLTVNELQIPIRDDSLQAHMDGDKLNIVDPKNIHFDKLNKTTLGYLGEEMTPESVEKDTREKIDAFNSATVIDGGGEIRTPITTPFTSDGNPAPAEVAELVGKVNDVVDKAIDVLNASNPLICDVCGKVCKNQLGLNSHKKSHKGEKS